MIMRVILLRRRIRIRIRKVCICPRRGCGVRSLGDVSSRSRRSVGRVVSVPTRDGQCNINTSVNNVTCSGTFIVSFLMLTVGMISVSVIGIGVHVLVEGFSVVSDVAIADHRGRHSSG